MTTSTVAEWGELLSEYDGSETHDHLSDVLGSTDALLDESQTATDRYQYRAFGVQTQQGSHASPFTFVGSQNYYRDSELELYYAGARYYDPAAGRWLSEDPIGLAAGDADVYRYVRNNPVNETDPSGEGDLIEWLLGKPLADWLSGKDAPGARTRLVLELASPGPDRVTAGSRRGRALEQAWSDYNKGYELAQRLDAAVGQMLEAVEQADRLMLDLGSSFIPIVSDLRDLQELITGTDLINQQKLDLLDRALIAVAAILPLVAGRHVRIVRHTLGNFAAWLSEALRRRRFPERAGDRLLKVKSLIRNTEVLVQPDRVTEGVREVGAAMDAERAATKAAQEGVTPLTIRSLNDLPFTSREVDFPLDLGNLSLERVTAFENALAPNRVVAEAVDSVPQVRLNSIQGEVGEAAVRQRLLGSRSVDLVGEQVRVRTPGVGSHRVTDLLVRGKKTGRLRIIEVKTGGATRDATQLAKDALIANPLAPTAFFGRRARAAGFPTGTPTGPIRTFEVNASNLSR